MLDHDELDKYFTKEQAQDVVELRAICDKRPPGRIRRNRFRKIKPDHIPRPINSFMTYRTEQQSIVRKFCPTANHREISKMVAKWWHNISNSEKASYIDHAKEAKRIHYERYPDYIFRPKSKRTSSKTPKVTSNTIDSVRLEKTSTTPLRNKVPQSTTASNLDSIPNHVVSSQSATIRNLDSNVPSYVVNSQSISNELFSNDYNYNIFGNNMYCDGVLFDTQEESMNQVNYWNTANQPTGQLPPNPLCINPNQVHQHTSWGDFLSYYASPITKPLVNGAIGRLNSVMPINTAVCNPAMISNAQQMYATPPLENEITPQSQTMGTPRISYPSTPYLTAQLPLIDNPGNSPVNSDQKSSSLFGNFMPQTNIQISPSPLNTSNNTFDPVLGNYSYWSKLQ